MNALCIIPHSAVVLQNIRVGSPAHKISFQKISPSNMCRDKLLIERGINTLLWRGGGEGGDNRTSLYGFDTVYTVS
jgi:hypothetical protein